MTALTSRSDHGYRTLCLISDITAVECLKDEALGDVDGNKYYCEDESKPECCEMNESFTCCELDSVKNM